MKEEKTKLIKKVLAFLILTIICIQEKNEEESATGLAVLSLSTSRLVCLSVCNLDLCVCPHN